MSVAQLQTALDALDGTIAALYTSPKPSYSIGDRSFSWDQYRASLMKERAELKQLILNETGAVEIRSIALG